MSGPLASYRVLELAEGVSGPQTALALADAGADVIKVERSEGDRARGWGSDSADTLGAAYLHLNRNKLSIGLDLDSPTSVEIVRRLVERADVVVVDAGWSSAPELQYDQLSLLNSGMVYCSLSLFGERGPWANWPPHGELPVQLASEAPATFGRIGEPPVRVANELAGGFAASHAIQGICAALLAADELGGQRVDVSLYGSMLAMRSTLWVAQSNPDEWFGWFLDSYVKPVNYGYRCKDGFIFMGLPPFDEEGRDKLVRDLGMDSWVKSDPLWDTLKADRAGVGDRYSHTVQPLWERALSEFTVDEAIAIISENGGSAFPKNTYGALVASAQVQHAEMIQTVDQSSGDSMEMQMPPWDFSETPADIRMGAPLLGEHGLEILSQLGYEPAEISRFRDEEILVGAG